MRSQSAEVRAPGAPRRRLLAALLALHMLDAGAFAARAEAPAAVEATAPAEPVPAAEQQALAEPPALPAPGDDAAPATDAPALSDPPTTAEICALIALNADVTGMPRDFFARLIWKESRFDSGAVSPVGAQGIAQFMPYTARERGLADPYDLVEAIRHSSLYLRDLKNELGNWGLAAAAYNGGINRVKGWLARGGSLPYETEAYVHAITFRPADWFREEGREIEDHPLDAALTFEEACAQLPIMKTRAIFAAVSAESAPMQPWGAQVAGHTSEAVAMKMFRRLQASYPGIFGDRQPIVVRERPISGPRRVSAVRIGADSRAEADAFCGRLRSAGAACVVMKN